MCERDYYVYSNILLKKALVLIPLLLGSYFTKAQIDIDSLSRESPYGPFTTSFFTEKQIKYGDTTGQFLDTLPDNFQRFDQVSLSNFRFQNLGNLGTALWPIFYEPPKIIGKTSGFSSYDHYFKSPDEIRYFNTKSPYQKTTSQSSKNILKSPLYMHSLPTAFFLAGQQF